MDAARKKQLFTSRDPHTADRETWRLYGELLTANNPCFENRYESAACLITTRRGAIVEIPLDENKSPLTTRRCIIKGTKRKKPSTNIR